MTSEESPTVVLLGRIGFHLPGHGYREVGATKRGYLLAALALIPGGVDNSDFPDLANGTVTKRLRQDIGDGDGSVGKQFIRTSPGRRVLADDVRVDVGQLQDRMLAAGHKMRRGQEVPPPDVEALLEEARQPIAPGLGEDAATNDVFFLTDARNEHYRRIFDFGIIAVAWAQATDDDALAARRLAQFQGLPVDRQRIAHIKRLVRSGESVDQGVAAAVRTWLDEESERARPERKSGQASPAHEALGWTIGCWLGRHTVACSAIRIDRDSGREGLPAGAAVHGGLELRTRRLAPGDGNTTRGLDDLAELILEVIRELRTRSRSSTIGLGGIGTPGIVDLQTGMLTLSVTIPEGSSIPRLLAERLIARDRRLVEHTFRVSPHEPDDLASRFVVDNDVRCVARDVLAREGWPTFACLYIGSGVGAALVIDGKVHVGIHGSAGHIGHVELHSALTGRAGDVGRVRCDCGRDGHHFEPLANFAGLERIASGAADNADVIDDLADIWAASGQPPTEWMTDGMLELLAPSESPAEGLVAFRAHAMKSCRGAAELVRTIAETHAEITAAGIAALTQLVDPGTVVLCGRLAERMRSNHDFQLRLRDALPDQLLDVSAKPKLADASAVRSLWRGAALATVDPAFKLRVAQAIR